MSACADIDIIVFHPSYVYVPRPGEKPADTEETLRSNGRGRPPKWNGHLGKQKLDSVSLLKETVLIPLERAGIIAATLNESQRKWQGIIRVPEENEDNLKRALGVRDRLGTFRRMDITYASSRCLTYVILTSHPFQAISYSVGRLRAPRVDR